MRKMPKNILKGTVIGLAIILGIIASYTGITFIFSHRNMRVGRTEYDSEQYKVALQYLRSEYGEYQWIDEREFRKIVEKDLGMGVYFYKEKHNMGSLAGLTNLWTRTITISLSLSSIRYYQVFVHEAIHLSQFTVDESYTCITTFKYLYEHENKTLRTAGIYYGMEVLRGCFSQFYEYDIKDLIVEYLINEGVIKC